MVVFPRPSASRCAKSKPLLRIRPGSALGETREKEFLDRWSPKTDLGHYDRVWIYRKRKETVARHQQRQERQRAYILKAGQSDSESSWPSIQTNSFYDDRSHPSLASPETNISQSSYAVTDLSTALRDELDDYDKQIETLQRGSNSEWPVSSLPRSTLRIRGFDPKQKATEIKQWAFVQGMMYGGTSATLRDTDRVHPPESYRVGIIFSAPHHTAGSSDEGWVSISDPYQTATPFGIVYSKFRKMVVIKVFGEHCICVPIYSHNGRGLEGKEFIKEYVSIRDVSDPKPVVPEGLHMKLLAVANPEFRGKVVSGKSNVKLTEFFSHRFTAPATMEGELDNKSCSTGRLLELVQRLGG
ncbi:hypothetical protein F5Y10DRAFT_269959 [Nemania abortiva]|nr:hypothetical protein F5Y10DRAFT_269959 [Nemania abortiva]